MGLLDLIIVFGYLVGITLFGIWFAGKQETTEDYFVGGRNVPWWANSPTHSSCAPMTTRRDDSF
jgi:Na+/proline symporter